MRPILDLVKVKYINKNKWVCASAWPQAHNITEICLVYFDRFNEEPAIVGREWYVASDISLINMMQHKVLGSQQDNISSSYFGK